MTQRYAIFPVVFGLAFADVVGTPALSHGDELLDLRQELNEIIQRLSTVEQRLQQLEPAAKPPASTIVPQPKPTNAVSGWRLEVFPFDSDGNLARAPVFRAIVSIGVTAFDAHLKEKPIYKSVAYREQAFFRSKESGFYTFSMEVKPASKIGMQCQVQMSIDQNELFSGNVFHEESFTKEIELQEGMYELNSEVGCYPFETAYAESINGIGSVNAKNIDKYSEANFNHFVMSPHDVSLRSFDKDELFVLDR